MDKEVDGQGRALSAPQGRTRKKQGKHEGAKFEVL